MKLLTILSIIIIANAQVAHAYTFNCNEINTKKSSKYLVTVDEVADITKEVRYGDKYDKVARVNVVINTTNGKEVKPFKAFQATATSEDVMYTVSAVKSQGVKIGIYLDEADDAYLELTNSKGQKTNSQLHCE